MDHDHTQSSPVECSLVATWLLSYWSWSWPGLRGDVSGECEWRPRVSSVLIGAAKTRVELHISSINTITTTCPADCSCTTDHAPDIITEMWDQQLSIFASLHLISPNLAREVNKLRIYKYRQEEERFSEFWRWLNQNRFVSLPLVYPLFLPKIIFINQT